jgi:hypothetical protein
VTGSRQEAGPGRGAGGEGWARLEQGWGGAGAGLGRGWDPSTKKGPLLTYLRTLGSNGEGAAARPTVRGYDDAIGVGSPARYIQSF